jgi:hypothetical protein
LEYDPGIQQPILIYGEMNMTEGISINEQLSVSQAERGVEWLKTALQTAVKLEFATIPPYLCAMWSIKDDSVPAYESIREIVMEEMLHLGLVCNLLTTLGDTPRIWPDAAPQYPSPLPGGVRPGLIVSLGGMTPLRVRDIFMQIEKPDRDLVDLTEPNETTPTIGKFYEAIGTVIQAQPETIFTGNKQLTKPMGPYAQKLFKILSKADALKAIDLIKEQGEGTTASPRDPTIGGSPNEEDLAHYYRFMELVKGKKIVQDPATGKFVFSEIPVPFPETYRMAEVPEGGWQGSGTPVEKLKEFDLKYTEMLKQLHEAWETGEVGKLNLSINTMRDMTSIAMDLMQIEITPGGETYGPCFRMI